jgi:hypothetical protein
MINNKLRHALATAEIGSGAGSFRLLLPTPSAPNFRKAMKKRVQLMEPANLRESLRGAGLAGAGESEKLPQTAGERAL